MVVRRGVHWIAVTLFLQLALTGAAWSSEVLDYRVVYKGVFSAGAELPIADLRLDIRNRPGKHGLLETRIEASSAAYPVVESLYPVRYRFRNWTMLTKPATVLGFETYRSTRKLRHRLYLRDDLAPGFRRYDLAAGAGRREISRLEAGESPVKADAGKRQLDRLALLQLIRRRPLREQVVFHFKVTNGREWMQYRVKVEAAQVLNLNGANVPAWKLRFDGSESDPSGRWEPAHRPVYLWLSQAPGRIPLRIESRHGIGLFRIELKNRAALEKLAKTRL
jgi:hypothetical protein